MQEEAPPLSRGRTFPALRTPGTAAANAAATAAAEEEQKRQEADITNRVLSKRKLRALSQYLEAPHAEPPTDTPEGIGESTPI